MSPPPPRPPSSNFLGEVKKCILNPAPFFFGLEKCEGEGGLSIQLTVYQKKLWRDFPNT